MNTATKLGSYGVILAVALGGGAALGATVGPDPGEDVDSAHGGHGSDGTAAPSALPGLAVSDAGYTLVPETPVLTVGTSAFRFQIAGADGQAVTQFETKHDKELHLIAVSRDLGQYAHLHPQRDATGTWSVDIPGLGAGPQRIFADFQASGGPSLTLGVDVVVPGNYMPPTRPDARASAQVDGFEVQLDGTLDPKGESSVVVLASRDGQPVELEPYLGANGHLVAIREGDLAYLHVHPEEGNAPAGSVPFALHTPSAGRYRLFFDFQVDGVVRTADFTVDVAAAGPSGDHSDADADADADAHGDEH